MVLIFEKRVPKCDRIIEKWELQCREGECSTVEFGNRQVLRVEQGSKPIMI